MGALSRGRSVYPQILKDPLALPDDAMRLCSSTAVFGAAYGGKSATTTSGRCWQVLHDHAQDLENNLQVP
jgi:hypothetical protein